MKLTKGQVEDAVAKKVIEFYVESLGVGPRETKVYIVKDMVIVRMKGKLLPIEEQLLGGEQGVELVKTIRKAFHELNSKRLGGLIEEVTKHKVVSIHSDVSTRTGEKFDVFILETDFELELG